MSHLVACRGRYAKISLKGKIGEEQAEECIVANATALLVLQIHVKAEVRPRISLFEFWCGVVWCAVRCSGYTAGRVKCVSESGGGLGEF